MHYLPKPYVLTDDDDIIKYWCSVRCAHHQHYIVFLHTFSTQCTDTRLPTHEQGVNYAKEENPVLATQRFMDVVDITVAAMQDDLAIVSACFNPQVHMRTCLHCGEIKRVRSASGCTQYTRLQTLLCQSYMYYHDAHTHTAEDSFHR